MEKTNSIIWNENEQVGLPNGAKSRLGRGKINQVKFFPDGKRLAVVSSIGVWIYDSETGEALELITEGNSPVTTMTISTDGKLFATSCENKSIQVWDTITYQLKGTCVGQKDDVDYLTFDITGKTLTSVNGKILIWNIDTCELIDSCLTDFSTGVVMTYTPDKNFLLAVGNTEHKKSEMVIWETQNYEVVKEIYLETNFDAAAISPDQKILATGDAPLQFWEIETGKPLSNNTEWVGEFQSMEFSPDGRKLVTGSRWDRVDVWDVSTVELLHSMVHGDEVTSVSYSPDGLTIVSGSEDGEVRVWDADTGELRNTISGYNPKEKYSVSFSPDGNTLTCGEEDGIQWWDLQSGENVRNTYVERNQVYSLTFSVDGSMLVSRNSSNKIRIWDVETGRFLGSFRGDGIHFTSFAISPNGRMLATATRENKVCIWEICKDELNLIGDCMLTLSEHTDEVNTVAFSPDGKSLASGSNDRTIKIWDVDSSTLQNTLTGHEDSVSVVMYLSDGSTLVSGSKDGTIHLWDVDTGELLTLISDAGAVSCIACSPNCKLLAHISTNEKVIHLWNVQSGERVQTFEGHTQDVNEVAFSPDSKTVATVSSDGTVLLWDISAL